METTVILYREGKLTGIHYMKVSTKKDNIRASDNTSGVIIFYCGPGVASKAYFLLSIFMSFTLHEVKKLSLNRLK